MQALQHIHHEREQQLGILTPRALYEEVKHKILQRWTELAVSVHPFYQKHILQPTVASL
uniref:Uncharacterized protein n=1 Tax=Arundo donax TaxID=35708 RepID=A0A0A9FRH5_ARUDO